MKFLNYTYDQSQSIVTKETVDKLNQKSSWKRFIGLFITSILLYFFSIATPLFIKGLTVEQNPTFSWIQWPMIFVYLMTFADLGITAISSGTEEYRKTGDLGKAAGKGALSAVASVGPLEGATIGATIGSVIPGVGTTAGAVAGGVIGGAIQGFKWIEPKFFDDPVQGTKNIAKKVGNGIKAFSKGLGGIGKALGFG